MAEQVTNVKEIYGGVSKTVLTLFDADGATLSDKVFTLMDCIEGTTSMTKEAGDSTEIKSEQGAAIYVLTTPGTRVFATETGDLQESVLTGLFGFKKASDGMMIEPVGTPEIYAQVEIYFGGGTAKCIGYKVKLDPSVTLEGLNSGIGRGVISGTLMNVDKSASGDGSDLRAFGIGKVVK